MKIACYYPDLRQGRNDGNPLYVWYNLGKIFGSDNVPHIWPRGKLDDPIYGKPDFHFWIDYGEDALERGEENIVCPRPNAYWASDTHLGFDYRLRKAKEFDFVFCAQERAVHEFKKAGIKNCFWLPHAYDPLAYSPGTFDLALDRWDIESMPEKKYDVSFIGNLHDENRMSHLTKLFDAFPNNYFGTHRFHEAAKIYNESYIVFNISVRKELNMRMFEALGSGAFLLTDNIDPSQNVFEEGKHFIGYDNKEEMLEKANYYLNHEYERELVAIQGHREAASKHTYLHRVMTMLDTIGLPYDKEKATSLLPKYEVCC